MVTAGLLAAGCARGVPLPTETRPPPRTQAPAALASPTPQVAPTAGQAPTAAAPTAAPPAAPAPPTEPAPAPAGPTSLLQPGELIYLGAFRLPAGSGDSNWEYSGYAMTCYPGGDPDGPDDGFPGSLFILGHDQHQLVSEVSIPIPVVSARKDPADLNVAATLQPFADITGGMFGALELPRAGLEYLPPQAGQESGKLHFAWGQHFQFEQAPSHGWAGLDLSNPQPAGPWYLDGFTNYVGNDYLFEIPAAWAELHTPGLRLATGRFRDGIWGGLGPALLAIGPWTEGNPPAPGARLARVTPLLLYGQPMAGAAEIDVSGGFKMNGFAEPDEWSGGAWLTAGERAAVVLVGTKALGKSWYGFSNGVVYPTSGDPNETYPEVPPWPHDQRGWWSEEIQAQMLFFNPDELAAVAHGQMPIWGPQPYATLDLTAFLLDPGFDYERAKRYLAGALAFDRENDLIYLVERMADENEKSVVHVLAIR